MHVKITISLLINANYGSPKLDRAKYRLPNAQQYAHVQATAIWASVIVSSMTTVRINVILQRETNLHYLYQSTHTHTYTYIISIITCSISLRNYTFSVRSDELPMVHGVAVYSVCRSREKRLAQSHLSDETEITKPQSVNEHGKYNVTRKHNGIINRFQGPCISKTVAASVAVIDGTMDTGRRRRRHPAIVATDAVADCRFGTCGDRCLQDKNIWPTGGRSTRVIPVTSFHLNSPATAHTRITVV